MEDIVGNFTRFIKQDDEKGNLGKYHELVKMREENKLPDPEQVWQILNEGKPDWRSKEYFEERVKAQALYMTDEEKSKKIAHVGDSDKSVPAFLFEKLPNGDEHFWLKDGTPYGEILANGTEHYWDKSGQLERRQLLGVRHDFAYGVIMNESLPDGTQRQWYDKDRLRYESHADGSECGWSYDGKKNFEKLSDGSERRWTADGVLESECNSIGDVTTYYDNGQKHKEWIKDTYKEWDKDGKPLNGDFSVTYEDDSVEHLRLYKDGKLERYDHFDKEGKMNTKAYLRLKAVAEKRIKGTSKDTSKGSVISSWDKIVANSGALSKIKATAEKIKNPLGLQTKVNYDGKNTCTVACQSPKTGNKTFKFEYLDNVDSLMEYTALKISLYDESGKEIKSMQPEFRQCHNLTEVLQKAQKSVPTMKESETLKYVIGQAIETCQSYAKQQTVLKTAANKKAKGM